MILHIVVNLPGTDHQRNKIILDGVRCIKQNLQRTFGDSIQVIVTNSTVELVSDDPNSIVKLTVPRSLSEDEIQKFVDILFRELNK